MVALGRIICIGDPHGSIYELDELLKKVQYVPNVDRVIIVGDLIDRGTDSVGVVRRARELKLECVRGNHENKFLKWYRGNKYLDKHNHYTQFSDEDIQYISSLPYSIKVKDDLWVVHAGVKPFIQLEKQSKDDLMYLRFTDKNREFISMRRIAKGEGNGAMFWTEFGPFGTNIIYGHHVHSMTDVRIDKQEDGFSCYGIDTGCVFGGNLSALIWESKEIVQVKAKKIYYKSGF